jgi:hypothetical protein
MSPFRLDMRARIIKSRMTRRDCRILKELARVTFVENRTLINGTKSDYDGGLRL